MGAVKAPGLNEALWRSGERVPGSGAGFGCRGPGSPGAREWLRRLSFLKRLGEGTPGSG
ncbi:hypothetical protein J2S03_001505 [Alicyclobacillus cycloheptanicus]|uniref:Uncharacterized protein n=1 Tax=Alicyclobacillus cycloheptanicus TaxID=1457 RepID=A0ABT9XHA6_9BACL|nr:hypothetical protein [Alicyclobacillus cycloheptanicus]